MLELNITQFTIFNVISLIIAFNINFDLFYKICYILFNLKVELTDFKFDEIINVQKKKFDINSEEHILTLPLPERINKVYWIFKNFCKIKITDSNCLYYSNPLNIVIYIDNSYKNIFSKKNLFVKNKSNLYLGYFITIDNKIYDAFTLDSSLEFATSFALLSQ